MENSTETLYSRAFINKNGSLTFEELNNILKEIGDVACCPIGWGEISYAIVAIEEKLAWEKQEVN